MPERKVFGEQHLDDIMDSAENPLDGKKWWMGADEPWQLLATCKEIRNALNWGPVETFPSRMHVHQVLGQIGFVCASCVFVANCWPHFSKRASELIRVTLVAK